MNIDKGHDCPNPKHFICAGCGEDCIGTTPDEELVAEHERNRPLLLEQAAERGLPPEAVDDVVRVCDDCYQKLVEKGLVT